MQSGHADDARGSNFANVDGRYDHAGMVGFRIQCCEPGTRRAVNSASFASFHSCILSMKLFVWLSVPTPVPPSLSVEPSPPPVTRIQMVRIPIKCGTSGIVYLTFNLFATIGELKALIASSFKDPDVTPVRHHWQLQCCADYTNL